VSESVRDISSSRPDQGLAKIVVKKIVVKKMCVKKLFNTKFGQKQTFGFKKFLVKKNC